MEAVPAGCHVGTLQIRSHILFGDKFSVIRHETSKEENPREVKSLVGRPIISSGVLKRNAPAAEHDRRVQGCEVRPELQSAEKSRRTQSGQWASLMRAVSSECS